MLRQLNHKCQAVIRPTESALLAHPFAICIVQPAYGQSRVVAVQLAGKRVLWPPSATPNGEVNMAQRIEYAVFPNIREDAFIATMNKIHGHVRRSQLSARDFREWMKDEGLWNKDDAAQMLSFIDVRSETNAQLGPWAEKFFAAPDDDQAKEMLYKRLADENTLLVKYVLEALDIEGGGRLHSTYELHRMLTSYVYPGKHIGLVPFQNWIKWIVASGRVKLIGIRWGLTDLGKQAVPRVRSIDVDEFLEDEAAGVAVAAPAAAAPAPVAAAATPAAKAPTAKAKAAAAAQDGDGDSEEMLDLPPEAEPVDESLFQQYEAKFEQAEAEPAPAPPKGKASKASIVTAPAETPAAPTAKAAALPRQTTGPAAIARLAQLEVACAKQAPEVVELITQLRDYGRANALGGGSLLLAHGLESRLAQNEAARHLFLAALLARLYAARADGSLAELLIERVGALAPVAVLLDRPEALAEVVVRWGLAAGDAASNALRAVLFDAVLGGRALKAQADLPTALAESASAEVLIGQLNQGLLRAAPVTAQLWLVREMVRAGLWTRASATEIAFVPSRAVRLMAYRLRMIDSHFALSAAALIQIARRLVAVLPPGSVEAAAFEALAPNDHLRFDCSNVVICQQPCAYAGQD